ncbi:MAG TPA: thioredoxin domain-containing protein [Caulobacteraceae bacterium]|nr:thioredoxin domain-containing protein [Caulobacteraceae bacterium]
MRRFAALVLCLGLAVAACKPSSGGGGTAGSPQDTGEHSLGNPQAKVTVIEYASLGCPICALWNNTQFEGFKAKYIDTGKVHYIYREFLTGDAPVASAGFLLAHCAGKDKYFQVVDAVYRAEAPLLESNQNAEKRDALIKVAQTAGLTEQQFNTCVTDDKALLALNDQSNKYATDDKIDSTPTFVVNGKPVVGGDEPALEKAIADAQAAAK